MLTQAKIDLAVLLKLFQHSEEGGEPEPPREIAHLFGIHISIRRIELSLETLEARGEIEKVYHPHYFEEGLWQISREGLRTVEKAIRLPSSFIARLHASGDQWLDTEEAQNAQLSKNSRYDTLPVRNFPLPAPTQVSPSSSSESAVGRDAVSNNSSAIDWTKWGAVSATLALPIALLTWWFS